MDPWRNGKASDSRSDGCVFDSRRVQNLGTVGSLFGIFVYGRSGLNSTRIVPERIRESLPAVRRLKVGEEVKTVIPDSLLKKNKRNEEWELAKKQELEAAKRKNVEKRKLAMQYAKDYEAQVYVKVKPNGSVAQW
ncbi:hypothetical protein ES288_A09G135700v1 [Gossypium darwinii]|uniref:Ribosomal protein L30 N-terminal domain-containing protein n=1 Tax=Gossypium darwinii TaxID=34276 RepID=A0A5D2F997_GOSDA|nr:hypothetical protein ES288_A09G135700v1 [Gossypium darwinii]